MSSLRVIGSVGEPINPEAWNWYNENVGHKECAVVDTYWQVSKKRKFEGELIWTRSRREGGIPLFPLQELLS